MKREAKLDQLRSMGVVDMELTEGCIVKTISEEGKIVGFEYVLRRTTIYVMRKSGYMGEFCDLNNIETMEGYKKIGHPLTYGRVFWRLDNFAEEYIPYSIYENFIKDIADLRHNKDKPLSEQENREEICDLIINLGK